jgi:hypothetical protein
MAGSKKFPSGFATNFKKRFHPNKGKFVIPPAFSNSISEIKLNGAVIFDEQEQNNMISNCHLSVLNRRQMTHNSIADNIVNFNSSHSPLPVPTNLLSKMQGQELAAINSQRLEQIETRKGARLEYLPEP